MGVEQCKGDRGQVDGGNNDMCDTFARLTLFCVASSHMVGHNNAPTTPARCPPVYLIETPAVFSLLWLRPTRGTSYDIFSHRSLPTADLNCTTVCTYAEGVFFWSGRHMPGGVRVSNVMY